MFWGIFFFAVCLVRTESTDFWVLPPSSPKVKRSTTEINETKENRAELKSEEFILDEEAAERRQFFNWDNLTIPWNSTFDLDNDTAYGYLDPSSTPSSQAETTTTSLIFRLFPIRVAVRIPDCDTEHQVNSRPGFERAYSVDAGRDVNLTCFSRGNHDWKSSAPNHEHGISWELIESFDDFDSLPSGYPDSLRDMDHFTTLMLTNVDHGDAGTYSCRRSAAEIVPIDIFVYDPEHPASAPFDPDPDSVVQVFAFIGEEAFIPCIPSHPDFPVRLEKQGYPVRAFTFDPRRGFRIPTVSKSLHAGTYKCIFSSTLVFEDIRRVRLSADVRPVKGRKPEEPPEASAAAELATTQYGLRFIVPMVSGLCQRIALSRTHLRP